MRASPRLIETRNRHPVLSIPRSWPQHFRLRRTHIPSMTTPMPIVPVDPLQVERTTNIYREDFVIGQIRCIPPQFCQIASSNLFLDLVPSLRTLTQRVRLHV